LIRADTLLSTDTLRTKRSTLASFRLHVFLTVMQVRAALNLRSIGTYCAVERRISSVFHQPIGMRNGRVTHFPLYFYRRKYHCAPRSSVLRRVCMVSPSIYSDRDSQQRKRLETRARNSRRGANVLAEAVKSSTSYNWKPQWN